MKRLKKFIEKVKVDNQLGKSLVELDIRTVRMVFSDDESFENNPDLTSQMGYILFIFNG